MHVFTFKLEPHFHWSNFIIFLVLLYLGIRLNWYLCEKVKIMFSLIWVQYNNATDK